MITSAAAVAQPDEQPKPTKPPRTPLRETARDLLIVLILVPCIVVGAGLISLYIGAERAKDSLAEARDYYEICRAAGHAPEECSLRVYETRHIRITEEAN